MKSDFQTAVVHMIFNSIPYMEDYAFPAMEPTLYIYKQFTYMYMYVHFTQ